jgi:hypothetical protein
MEAIGPNCEGLKDVALHVPRGSLPSAEDTPYVER